MAEKGVQDRANTISGQLAGFAASLRYDALPDDIKRLAQLCLLDTLGAALAGATADEIIRARRAMIATNGAMQGDALLWGTNDHANLSLAVLSNAASCHAREIDDFGGCAHSGAVVIPAALGLAARMHASGKELLTSIVIGYEIARRVMDGAGGYYPFKKRGWHSTSTCGVFGAAAASARLLGLDARGTQLALGFAGSNAGGTWAFIPDGAMNKRIHPGFAAQTGIVSAYLAADGVTSPSGIFETEWGGFYPTYAGEKATPAEATSGLGTDYRMRLVGFKPYAACRGIHSSIDIALALRNSDRIRPDDIESVTVRCSSTQLKQLYKMEVRTRLDAQFSLPYGFAVALLTGGAMLDQYTEEAIVRPEILALARKITMVVDASMNDDDEPPFEIRMKNGELLKRHVPIALGDHANPLDEKALRAKFRIAASAALSPQQISDLEDCVANIDKLDNASDVVKRLSPGQSRTAQSKGGIVAPQGLANLANHEEAALPPAYRPRVLHLSDKIHPGADLFITSRTVDNLPGPAEPNVMPHTHPVSQTYVFTSETGDFEVDVELSGEHIVARAPSTAFIPAGVEHSLRILKGSGTVLSIVRSGVYE